MSTEIKLCECNCCGQPAPIATKTDKKAKQIKGQPIRFIVGHNKGRRTAPKLRKNNTSGFHGVRRCGNRWHAQITVNGKHISIGLFDTPVHAAAAYNFMAKALHGEFATFNDLSQVTDAQCLAVQYEKSDDALPNEQWKPVVGFEGLYEVSDMGRVRSLERHTVCVIKGTETTTLAASQILLFNRNPKGYLSVALYKDGELVRRRVNRLVAEAFLENPDNKPWVNHLQLPKSNNCVSNLEWATVQEDVDYKVFQGRHPHGKTHGCAKLTEEQIIEMRELRVQGWLLRELAAHFNISITNVNYIVRGKAWKHVPLASTKKPVQAVRSNERKIA